MTDEREKLERAAFTLAVSPSGPRREALIDEVMAAADAYAAADRLAEHVKTCEAFHMERSVAEYASSQPVSKTTRCGTGDPIYYCEDAPIKEGVSEQ